MNVSASAAHILQLSSTSPCYEEAGAARRSLQPRFSLVPAAYVFLMSDADPALPGKSSPRVLLQLRRNTGYLDGYWACGAAGHVESGESAIAAAIREAHEELGVDIDPVDLLPLTTMHRSNDPGGAPIEQRVDFFFMARRWSGQPRIAEDDKSADLAWYPLDALPELVPPHERAVCAMLRAHLDQGRPLAPIVSFGF